MKNPSAFLMTLILFTFGGTAFGQTTATYNYFDIIVASNNSSLRPDSLNKQTATIRNHTIFNNSPFNFTGLGTGKAKNKANFVIRGTGSYKDAVAQLRASKFIDSVETSIKIYVTTLDKNLDLSVLDSLTAELRSTALFNNNQFEYLVTGVKNSNVKGSFIIEFDGETFDDPVNDAIALLNTVGVFASIDYFGISFHLGSCNNPIIANDIDLIQYSQYPNIARAHLDLIDAQCAWQISTGNPTIIIGLVDDFLDDDHEDLIGKVAFNNGYNKPSDAHGTKCAGFAVAITNNAKGVSSIGYHCNLGFESVYEYNGADLEIKTAIENLAAQNVPIITVPWNNTHLNRVQAQAIVDQGSTLVLSAGNYPNSVHHDLIADIPGVIVVSGVHAGDNTVASAAHARNPYVDLLAPSRHLIACYPNDGYIPTGGTSFAAPIVSGTIGLILAENPCLQPREIEEILKYTTTQPLDAALYPFQIGTGVLNAQKAVQTAQEMKTIYLDLYTKDRFEDFGNQVTPYSLQADYDESPDIWVRNQPDGLINQYHQTAVYTVNSPNTVYVYVRVRNKSCVPSTGNEELNLYWSRLSSWGSWPDNWDGRKPLIGDRIGSDPKKIPALQAGESTILEFEWRPDVQTVLDNWSACLLSEIDNVIGDNSIHYYGRQDKDVRNNNNISMHNIAFVQGPTRPIEGTIGGLQLPKGCFTFIGNPNQEEHTMDIKFMESNVDLGLSIFSQAEVKIYFEQEDWDFIAPYIEASSDFQIIQPQEVRVLNDGATLANIPFNAEHRIAMYVGYQFLVEEPLTDNEYALHVREYLSEDGSLVGGAHFKIFKDEREEFTAEAGSDQTIKLNETITLSANTINESATYNWYNSDDSLIYTGTELTMTPRGSETYKLEVIADIDLAKDYDEVNVIVKKHWISNVTPNPAISHVVIHYTKITESNCYLLITNNLGTVNDQYTVLNKSSSLPINLSNYQSGLYTVTLFINGVNTDSEQFIIQ